MSPEFAPDEPLPCKDHHETDALTQEHALGGLVQPRAALGSGLHTDRLVQFDATAPPGHAPRHARDDLADHYFHLDDAARSRHLANLGANGGDATPLDPRSRADHNDDAAPQYGAVRDRQWRRDLLRRDQIERRVEHERLRRLRLERSRQRPAQRALGRGRRALTRARDLASRRERGGSGHDEVRGQLDRGLDATRDRRGHDVPGNDPRGLGELDNHMAAHSDRIAPSRGARLNGSALALYFALLPYVVVSRWQQTEVESNGLLIRSFLAVLTIFWIGFLIHVVRNVARLRRGREVKSSGSAWIAALLVAVLALAAPHHASSLAPHAIAVSYEPGSSPPPRHRLPPFAPISPVPLALMAKRRSDLLRHGEGDDLFDVDESIALLRGRDPELISRILALTNSALDGVLDVRDIPGPVPTTQGTRAALACYLGPSAHGSLIGFAREGGRLPIRAAWSADDIQREVIALHEGPIAFARDEPELLRALATRSLRQSVVLYLGAPGCLDDELSACAVTVAPYVEAETRPPHSAVPAPRVGDLCVELLRADPTVVGLVEPFTPTLRRRCLEMVAYLALHRHEPITGERLRTRVLVHADVEASSRTLANTASAVRRSLGVDVLGPRLHPVTQAGLYATHGLSSDVEQFSTLVSRARQLPLSDAASLCHEALLLIRGEPLASTLRGFEWFLAEGYAARLARDGEWSALALHHTAMQRGNYELAFWSIQQGLLIDPYSDALSDALTRVPRLREFGGDGAGLAQHQPIGAGGAVAMSWSLTGLSQQVFQ